MCNFTYFRLILHFWKITCHLKRNVSPFFVQKPRFVFFFYPSPKPLKSVYARYSAFFHMFVIFPSQMTIYQTDIIIISFLVILHYKGPYAAKWLKNIYFCRPRDLSCRRESKSKWNVLIISKMCSANSNWP